MRVRYLAIGLFATAVTAAAQSEGGEVFGPVTEFGQAFRQSSSYDGKSMTVDLHPWTQTKTKTDRGAMMDRLQTALPAGLRLSGPTKRADIDKLGYTIEGAAFGADASQIFFRIVCDYQGRQRHHRHIDIYGDKEMVAAVANPEGAKALVDKACSETPIAKAPAPRTKTSTSRPAKSRNTRMEAEPSYQVAPGKGVRAGDIIAAYNDTGLTYGMGGAKMRTTVWVPLKSGWAVRNPKLPMALIDEEAYRAADPKRWAKWRKRGGKIERQKADGDWTSINGTAYKPARRGQTLDGLFTYYSSSSMGGTSSSSRRWMRFRPDGSYEVGSSSMTASSGVMGSSVYSAGSKGPDGCASATSVSGGVVGGTSRRGECGDGKSGRYTVDGMMLTLEANDGTVRHVPFYLLGTGKAFVFDGKYFGREKG